MGERVCEVDRFSSLSCSGWQAGTGDFEPLGFITRELHFIMGRISVVGIVIRYELDGLGIESRWGARFSAPILLYNGYRVFPGGKAAGTWR
jgi:hypothetical protein